MNLITKQLEEFKSTIKILRYSNYDFFCFFRLENAREAIKEHKKLLEDKGYCYWANNQPGKECYFNELKDDNGVVKTILVDERNYKIKGILFIKEMISDENDELILSPDEAFPKYWFYKENGKNRKFKKWYRVEKIEEINGKEDLKIDDFYTINKHKKLKQIINTRTSYCYLYKKNKYEKFKQQ